MIPNNIRKEHLLKAIEEIDREGVRKGRHSSTYDLVYKGKSYPPKLVLSIANRYANGTELDSNDFAGGKGTASFELLEKEGFEIITKNDPVKLIIEDYKKHIAETKLKDEVYKWELINEYRGRPNPQVSDFYQEIKGVKFENLIYAMGMAVIHHLAKEKTEELRQLFINLYDEGQDLTERVKSFNKETLKIYRELGETLNHHQDERSIATYLTFHNPEKYTFYKASFYKKYCKLIGVKEAKKNEKYAHYLTLIDELIETYISPDNELIEQVKGLIPDYYNGTNHKLLAQDILYQMLDRKVENNYWIFQGNPKVFDFETALRNEVLTDWTVSAHKDKISIGDKVILWIAGSKSGCYALAEVTSKPHKKTTSPDDHLWKGEDKSELKADIKITHNLVDNPILSEKITGIEKLKNLKVGNQGTNFSATEEEYQAILDLSQNNNMKQYWLYSPGENAYLWDEFYKEGIMGLGWDDIGDLSQYANRSEIKEALVDAYGGTGSKKNDVSANDDFLNKINVGDVIIAKKGRGELLGYGVVTSDYIYDQNRKIYQKTRKVDWKLKGNWKVDFTLVLKTLTDITKYSSDHPDYNTYYERLLGIMGQNNKIEKNKDVKYALNTILYGPPGTGKTYNTILRAAEIIENRKIDSYDEALEIFKANLHDQIEFITFHQNYSYEDFIQGLRPETDNTSSLVFIKKDGVFKKIADKALDNLKLAQKSSDELSREAKFNKALELFSDKVLESEDNFKINDTAYIFEVEEDAFRYTGEKWTNHTNGFRMKFSDLREFYRNNVKSRKDVKKLISISGLANQHATYYYLVYTKIIKLLPKKAEGVEKIHRKNYVLIIDEINRANISRVFGELITLIEPDKRSHGKIPMEAKLPSGDLFVVPSNLYIIGTMNTADKSIALLDIALRRRFEFVPMYPKYSEDGLEIEDENVLKSINESIISEKGHDFQIGHSYFMDSKEDPYDFKERMNVKVIPLLLEYFMNDYKTVTQIISRALSNTRYSIDEKSWPLRISKNND